MANIEVLVEWGSPVVFAGEEVKCTITFKNSASASKSSRSPSPSYQLRTLSNARDRWKLDLPKQAANPSSSTFISRLGAGTAGTDRYSHRSTNSLSATIGTEPKLSPWPDRRKSEQAISAGHKHKKSVSIISIGQHIEPAEESESGATSSQLRNTRKTHNRSTSFQGLPLRSGSQHAGPLTSPGISHTILNSSSRSTTSPLSLKRASTSYKNQRPLSQESVTHKPALINGEMVSDSSTAKHARNVSSSAIGVRYGSRNNASVNANGNSLNPQAKMPTSAMNNGELAGDKLNNRTLQRIATSINMEETPRSSMDIYSHSNNSSETLASEYVGPPSGHQSYQPKHGRQVSRLAPLDSYHTQQETLMMGYVQLVGSFTLDGSLINLAPFESVKRKGVIGGQGSGGVVGVDSSKRDSGLFGALGWNNIGQSLGGLLGSQEPSSFREMKGIASSKSVPILSTPQSILFVDLKLGPGEYKKFSYQQALPRGIPPTHRGRAFKSSYQLVIGIQRPRSTVKQHTVRQVDVPFKVLPGINSSGEILGHDLMSPHILLKDMAITALMDIDDGVVANGGNPLRGNMSKGSSDSGFNLYVNSMLRSSREKSGLGLLSPTESTTPEILRDESGGKTSVKDSIDLAIQRGVRSRDTRKSASHFQIHRGGDKVATVALARSAYRLGDVVSSIIDFEKADLNCSTLIVSLETSEVVDPSIALRSSASVHRATRRVHAQDFENTICARRVAFGLMIPLSATPDFVTTGIHLEWKLRFEFITGDTRDSGKNEDIVEQVTEDERGTILAAVQELPCQSFDVSIPIRVYGSTIGPEEDKIARRFAI